MIRAGAAAARAAGGAARRAVARREWFKPGWRTQVLNVFYTQQVIVATYLTTAVWKLWKTNFGWIRESKYFPVQLAKTRGHRRMLTKLSITGISA